MPGPAVLLLLATALHLGFQLTVTLVVYPALAEAPDWGRAHAAHSRRIAPVVAVVYGALLLGLGAALAASAGVLDSPGGPVPLVPVLVAAAGAGLSLGSTALVAAPTHGRLAAGRSPELMLRLLRADRVRTLGAVLSLAGAVGAVSSWSV